MNRILVTGATGFVGRHVVSNLVARGKDVFALVREGKEDAFEGTLARDRIISTRSAFDESDAWWRDSLQGIDTVIHLAWYVVAGKYLTAPENIDCLIGTLRMAKAAADVGVRRFVGTGTCIEYDVSAGTLSTNTPLKPTTPYAAAKAAIFTALSELLPSRGTEFVWCRLFYLYGEGEDERRFVPYLRKAMSEGTVADLTKGTQVRDYLDVKEAAQQIVDAALGTKQGAVNICSGQPVTVREFAERIADEHGGRHLLNFGARPENLVDPPYIVGVKG
ncbi:NAD(P)-dependent oxidoreductase [Sinorhizobium sp. BJ1]|uniref:NAD-dependent epimerase/dehydratase family protein n=1 Tax=Sinorhizobium sp. BJ1 TaxID=2035455 RepID=UPI000BEA5AE5|nr:NAD(P)-dependent oxidoreductase [Sinorhizobium sp. BJ1]PDT82943.1 NAD-dependent epimerase/dehydratase [Sinorhizobium sp. BJ1]